MVTDEWKSLLATAEKINSDLPGDYKNAFFQLVLHPVKAYANLQKLYTAVAWNNLYAKNNNLLANKYAADAKRFLFERFVISNEDITSSITASGTI